jgi:mannose-6-phosphate isomerase
MTGIARLNGTVKHYDWGGTAFIPSLLQVENPAHRPFAEYWLGDHPLADCRLEWENGDTISLKELISQEGEKTLGKAVDKKFGSIPYLLKALDVKDMLSIQVHPSRKAAEKEFERENALGIPIDAPTRNYKDKNHKPELLVALGPFWLLHGFKPADVLEQVLSITKELSGLLPVFRKRGYEGLYKEVMEMPQEEVNKTLSPLLDRILPLYHDHKLQRSQEDFWAARAADTFSHDHAIDRGIFSIYFFNLLELKKGEAVFQDAGVPHAYLEGQNVEIMANSDNVLRGGLTSKHIDVNELLKHTRFEATKYRILKGGGTGLEKTYKTKAPDFELSCFSLEPPKFATFTSHAAEILLLTDGKVDIICGKDTLRLEAGKPSAFIFPDQLVKLVPLENATVFRATVPHSHT